MGKANSSPTYRGANLKDGTEQTPGHDHAQLDTPADEQMRHDDRKKGANSLEWARNETSNQIWTRKGKRTRNESETERGKWITSRRD
jgi:hypothetical protein